MAGGFSFKASFTDTGDDTLTASGVDIGVAHSNRVVIITASSELGNTPVVTVNGISPYTSRLQGAAQVFAFSVPSGSSGSISYQMPSSTVQHVSVYVGYPKNITSPLDSGGANGGAGPQPVISDLECQIGGFVVYAYAQPIVAFGSTGAVWNGVDPVIEDIEVVNLGGTLNSSHGHINTTENSTVRDLTGTASTTGFKRMAAMSFHSNWPSVGMAVEADDMFSLGISKHFSGSMRADEIDTAIAMSLNSPETLELLRERVIVRQSRAQVEVSRRARVGL